MSLKAEVGVEETLEQKFIDWALKLVGPLSESDIAMLRIAQYHFRKNKTEELPKSIFTKIHYKEKQRLLGITYTPSEVRKELTTQTLNQLVKTKPLTDLSLCDPCCGSGMFTISLLDELKSRGLGIIDSLEKNVSFFDIDKISVALSLLNIYEYCLRNDIDPTSLKLHCGVKDFFELNYKFDGFVTNPPYVKLQNLPTETREYLKAKYPNLFVGAPGLSTFFLKKMFDDLKPNGMIGIITQNNFFTSNSGKILRKEIQEHLFKVDNFGSEPVFNDVTAYTCLLYVGEKKSKYFSFKKINNIEDFNQDGTLIESSSLNHMKWRFGNTQEREDLQILEREGIPLGVACRIWVGIATQFDKAFTVFKHENKWIGETKNRDAIEVEPAIVKKLIRVADLTDVGSIKNNARGVIYPYKLVENKTEAFTENYFKSNFPCAYKFLSSWKQELLSREKGRVQDENWFKWGRIQSMIPIKGKLLTKTFNRGPCFYMDESDSLFSNGYALTISQNIYDLLFVRAVLNSSIFFYYAKLTSFEIEGEYQCYQKNFIEKFCLPIVSYDQQKKLLEDRKIEEFLLDYYKLNYNPT